MTMNLRDLQYFAVVAEHKHLGRAAEALDMSQPALSMSLRRLEEFLHTKLVKRTPKGVELTTSGEAVYAHARRLRLSVDDISREVADLNAVPQAERQKVFFDYWTLKEAYIKARGLGLALPLADFAFRLSPSSAPAISFEPSLPDDPATWQFAQDWPTPQHRLAVAVRRTGADLAIRIRQVAP